LILLRHLYRLPTKKPQARHWLIPMTGLVFSNPLIGINFSVQETKELIRWAG